MIAITEKNQKDNKNLHVSKYILYICRPFGASRMLFFESLVCQKVFDVIVMILFFLDFDFVDSLLHSKLFNILIFLFRWRFFAGKNDQRTNNLINKKKKGKNYEKQSKK